MAYDEKTAGRVRKLLSVRPDVVDADQEAALSTDGTAHAVFHHEAQTAHDLLFDHVWPDR